MIGRNAPLRRTTRLRSVRLKPRRRAWACRFCQFKNYTATTRCERCQIGKETKRTSLKKRCDDIARDLCRILARGICAKCARPGSDWAHRFPRRHHSLRWSMENCDFLCRDCHRFFTDHPLAFAAWLTSKIGGKRAEELEALANSPWDKDYVAVIASLQAQLRKAKEEAA